MASDDPLEPMRLYEDAMWPTIEHAERHYRRVDRLALVAYIGGVLMIAGATALLSLSPWAGALVGLSVSLGFQGGVVFKGVLLRREAFRRMRVLHEQAAFTLAYHGSEEP